MKKSGADDSFNIKTWEDLQVAIAQLLGMSIKITDDSGKITTSYDSFSDVCSAIKNSSNFSKACEEFHNRPPELTEDPVVCPGKICHYTVSSEFFYREYFVTVSGLCGEHDDDFIEETAKAAGIQPSDLGFMYATLPNYPQDRLKNWAALIGNMFAKVMEPAMQTSIMYMAEKEKEEQINKMKQLMQSNISINSTKVLAKLLSIITESAEKMVMAERGLIYFIDYEKNELYYEWTFTDRDKLSKNHRIKIGEGVLGVTAQTGVTQIVNDLSKEHRYCEAEKIDGIETKNMICVPIKTSSSTVGVLKLLNRQEGAGFNANDQVFLETLAAQAAIAIENAIIYENMEGAAFKLNHQLEKSNINLSIEKKRIESIVRSMEDAVIATDRNRRIVLINRVAERLFGINTKGTHNAPIDSFIKDTQTLQAINEALETLETRTKEFMFPVFDEDHTFAGVFTPILDEDGSRAGAVAVFRDITKTKKLENLKSEFLNMVAHELRTPLTPIIAYIQLMLVKNPTPEKIKKYATLIFRETQRLTTLINDLLDMSRIESGKELTMCLEPMDLTETAASVYETFKDASPKHTLVLDAPLHLTANADKDKMTQVLINLLSNATKYSPDGGEIKIRLFEEDSKICVAVIDHGIGIPQEDINKVFEKFHRVEDKQVHKVQGTGIGLTIVKNIMEYHKGGVTVKSEEGAGSTFTLWMPKPKQEE
jgi:two-component system phosphate regulon sensor histidine kinase PhoR